ncbi:hypothetical protein HZA55_01540 [Candidatus Poribacteria bacterium]|nr:hypothetical protein [Candidatus Poribacteria bacterium]
MEKIKKFLLKFLLYICIVIFYFCIWQFVLVLHDELRTATIWDINVKVKSDIHFSKLHGKIRKITKYKIERKVETIKRSTGKIELKDEEIIVKKGDTITNIVGLHYGKYSKDIHKIVEDANKGVQLTNLVVGQKIILPVIQEIQKESIPAPLVETKIIEKKIEIKDPINIVEIDALYNEKWISIKGQIYNAGNKEINFLKFNIDFLDKFDKVVYSNFTYIVKNEGLKINEKKDFELMSKYLPLIKKYEAWIEYY